ncbi:MAG TPA: hypothetical protein VFV89_16620 [Nocardioides sp.]|uniref:hypothetical protein n=1 Tax=Nocardioides sp. TaxID=35761 RepID=UPI002E32D7B4|nr:hypothetical protein [Nocardioides sp.]HEX5089432.1 hypothetical protein [Nocardioides sp.]
MNSLSVIAGMLQRLPTTVRRALYSFVSLAGLVLAVAQLLGWDDLGPISVARALQAYALVSPAVGVVAVANVTPAPPDVEDFDQDLDQDFDQELDDDVDLSSFVPAAQDDFSA